MLKGLNEYGWKSKVFSFVNYTVHIINRDSYINKNSIAIFIDMHTGEDKFDSSPGILMYSDLFL